MKMDDNYNQSVADAEKWLQQSESSYEKGVDILLRSRFKRTLAQKLKRLGEQVWTIDALKYSLQSLIDTNKPAGNNIKAEPSATPNKTQVKPKTKKTNAANKVVLRGKRGSHGLAESKSKTS